ncbi:MAG: hypothetical protein ACJ78Q_14985 [Chloroflexia bacterium]|jgi:hypothetical protein
MAQQLMWNQIEELYRGQGTNGTVITVESDAMQAALNRAGKSVYETDWWIETLQNVLEHWGVYSQRWLDVATRVPRMHFSLTPNRMGPGATQQSPTQQPPVQQSPTQPQAQEPTGNTGPINTGSLRERLKAANKLNSED